MQFEQLIENSLVKDLKINYKKEYRENYKYIRDESIYGLTISKSYLQKNIRTNEIFLCIQEIFYDHQSNKIVDMLEALQIVNGNQYLNQFKAFCYEEVQQNSIRLYILMEYFDLSLAKVAKKRIIIEKPLIDSLTQSFLKTISYLQKKDCSLLSFNLSNIFIKQMSNTNQDNCIIKILHFPFMQPSFDMVQCGKEKHYNSYLSVEELECLNNNQNNKEIDNCQSNIFSFGALLLDFLNSSNPSAQGNSIYSKDAYKINEKNFFDRINYIADKYPKKVFLLVEQLLKFNDRSSPRSILQQYENQQQRNSSQIIDDSIAVAKERMQNQLYSEFPIKNNIVSSPSNTQFTNQHSQNLQNNSSKYNNNNQSNNYKYQENPNSQYDKSSISDFPQTNSSQKNKNQEGSSYLTYSNQGYSNPSNFTNTVSINNREQYTSNGAFNPLGNSSQFDDSNRNNKGRSKWDIPSIHNSGGRSNNPLVTPFQNNHDSYTNQNNFNERFDKSPKFAENLEQTSPQYKLTHQNKHQFQMDSTTDQKFIDNQYNQFLFESVKQNENEVNTKKFVIQGRGENNQFVYKQPDPQPLLSSEYFKPYSSQSNHTSPLDYKVSPQNVNQGNAHQNQINQQQQVLQSPIKSSASQYNTTFSLNQNNNIQQNPEAILNKQPADQTTQILSNKGNNIPIAPPFNLMTNSTSPAIPPPPPFNTLQGASPSTNIPPPPPIGALLSPPPFSNIPPPPPFNTITQQITKNNKVNQNPMLKGSLEVHDESEENEQSRKKDEVIQKLFSNNNQAAPVKLPFFLPKPPIKEQQKNIENPQQNNRADPKIEKVEMDQKNQQKNTPSTLLGIIPPPPQLQMISPQTIGTIPPPPIGIIFPTTTGNIPPPPVGIIPPPPVGIIPPPPIGIIPQPPTGIMQPPPFGAIPPAPQLNLLNNTNFIQQPPLQSNQNKRDEQKERIEIQSKIQKQLNKESNDILSQSKSVLESSKRALDKASKRQENLTYSQIINEDDQDSNKKTDTLDKYHELKIQENEYLEQKQLKQEKIQKIIQQDKENTIQKIQKQHSTLFQNSSKKYLSTQEPFSSDRKEELQNRNKYQEKSIQENQQSNLYASFNPESHEKSQNTNNFNVNSVEIFDNENSHFLSQNNDSNNNPLKSSQNNSPTKEIESFRNEDDLSFQLKQASQKRKETFGLDNDYTNSLASQKRKETFGFDVDNINNLVFQKRKETFGFGFDNDYTNNYQLNSSSLSSQKDRNESQGSNVYKFPTDVIQITQSIGGSFYQQSDCGSFSLIQETVQDNQYECQPATLYNSTINTKNLLAQSTDQHFKEDSYQNNKQQQQNFNQYENQKYNSNENYENQTSPNNYHQPQFQNSYKSLNNTTNDTLSQNNLIQNQQTNQSINTSYSPSYLKQSPYSNIEFILEKSHESDGEEENSLIYKSPIQKNVQEYMTQTQKNKQFYEELRKQRPQGSQQYDPQEFDQIIQESKKSIENKNQRFSSTNGYQFEQSAEKNYETDTIKNPDQENFSQTSPHKNDDQQNNSYEKTYDEQILDDNKTLFHSEFKDFQDRELLIQEFYQQLKKFPNTKKIQFKNNQSYEGQVQKTDRGLIRNGFGVQKMLNKDLYCGYFKNGQFDGEGVYFYNHGDIYRGALKNNLRQGHGTYYYHEQGCIYSGDWIGNVKEGYGRLLMKNKEKYEGYFKQNVKCGHGVYYFGNGDTFEGEWVYDKKCGHGTLIFQDGNLFEGNFYDDLPYGSGQMKYNNGDQYQGNYEDGIIQGFGVYIHANDQYYQGDFNKNQMNGEGIYYFKNGDKYQGQYVDGQRDGYGKYYYMNGCIYEGYWKDNQKHGQGKYIFPDNTYYQGAFENSMKQGIGKQIFKDNEYYNGCWKNDKRNGKGFYQFKDGSYYEGDWLNDRMHGEGTYYLKQNNGLKQSIYGIWSDDELYQIIQ